MLAWFMPIGHYGSTPQSDSGALIPQQGGGSVASYSQQPSESHTLPQGSGTATGRGPTPALTLNAWPQGLPQNLPASIVVNLPRCTLRYQKVSESLVEAGIPFRRLANTADAHNHDIKPHECKMIHSMTCVPSYFSDCRDCTGGIAGCAISHMRGWQDSLAASPNAPWQAFTEDDTAFEPNGVHDLLATVHEVTERNPNWKLIFFTPAAPKDGIVGLHQWPHGYPQDFDTWIHACVVSGAWASFYILSASGLRQVVQNVTTGGFMTPLDVHLFSSCAPGECFTRHGGVVKGTASLEDLGFSLTMNTSATC